MPDSLLLTSQRNDVFLAVREAGFDPGAFTWERSPSGHHNQLTVSKLIHQASGGYFHFDLMNEQHFSRYSPGLEKAVDTNYPGPWAGQMGNVRLWLKNLKREVEAADLWETLTAERNPSKWCRAWRRCCEYSFLAAGTGSGPRGSRGDTSLHRWDSTRERASTSRHRRATSLPPGSLGALGP